MNEGLSSILGFTSDDGEDYYNILGCDELSSKEQITAEYKARVLQCHPDKHPDNPDKAAEFENIQTAKDILCDDERRANYDRWRHAGISMPFSQWCNLRGAVHTSMHWMTPKKERMIEGRCESDTWTRLVGKSEPDNWTRPDQPNSSAREHETTWASEEPSQPNYCVTDFTGIRQEDRVPWQRDEPSETLRSWVYQSNQQLRSYSDSPANIGEGRACVPLRAVFQVQTDPGRTIDLLQVNWIASHISSLSQI